MEIRITWRYAISLSLLAFFFARSQSTFNRSYAPKALSYASILFEKGSNLYFYAGESPAILRTDKSGNRRPFSQNASPLLYYAESGGTLAADKLVFVGYIDSYCSGGWGNFNFITITDTTGTTATTYTYDPLVPPVKAWVQLPDCTLATFGGSCMVRHTSTGSITAQYTLGIGSVASAIALSNGNILISGNSGAYPQLAEITSTGSIVAMQSQPILYNKLSRFGSQDYMALGQDGQVYKISPSMNMTGASSLLTGALVNDFVLYQDTIYAIVVANSIQGYVVADTAFSIIATTSNTTQSVSQWALRLTAENRIVILYSAMASPGKPELIQSLSSHHCIGIQSADKLAGSHFNRDLRLGTVKPVDIYGTYYNMPHLFMKAEVTLKNVGSLPVHAFYLNCYLYPPIHCGDNRYIEKFTKTILPGDSVTVTTQYIHRTAQSITITGNSISAPYCIYLTLPDSTTDADLVGNEICEIYSGLISGINENRLNTIRAYPNPFGGKVSITTDFDVTGISITDVSGREVYRSEQKMQAGNILVGEPHWNPGMYFLSVCTGTARKVIILLKE